MLPSAIVKQFYGPAEFPSFPFLPSLIMLWYFLITLLQCFHVLKLTTDCMNYGQTDRASTRGPSRPKNFHYYYLQMSIWFKQEVSDLHNHNSFRRLLMLMNCELLSLPLFPS